MYSCKTLILWLVLNLCKKNIGANILETATTRTPPVQRTASASNLHSYADSQLHAFESCNYDDFACLSMAASDKQGLDAIISLHRQLDDDEDGNIDYAESDDFLKEELKYDHGAEKRQRAFHRDNDMHISVKELWEAWLKSEVHNWTVEDTTGWLSNDVHLPQYVPNFVLHKVKGANLPRLAVNSGNYLGLLGIKDPIHKQKISLKAMDVVLFGPPKGGITWKDITLVLSLIVGALGGVLAYQQNKKFKNDLNRMNRDMDSLQSSEQALEKLQRQLEEAKEAQDAAISEKQTLERMLQDSGSGSATLTNAYSESDVTHYKEEINALKAQLEMTQAAFKNSCFVPPGLQQWLQYTYELEQKNYDKKKVSAEKQLQQAREACEKLKKKRSSLIGAFVSTHGKAIDDVDRAIVQARSALNEVTYELQERAHRWRQIELLCGFSVMVNAGLQVLENVLYRKPAAQQQARLEAGGRMNSVDDLDINDDNGSVYGLGHQQYQILSHNEDETSESENGKQDENANESTGDGAHFSFQIGDSPFPEDPGSTSKRVHTKSSSQSNISLLGKMPKPAMTRSFTQDINVEEIGKITAKASSSSDLQRTSPIQEAILVEDDIGSTDSSLIEDSSSMGDGKKQKKRKLFNFSKKPKKS
ncbi:unnamed protein product [Ceutorhynchus assimilis]|uniref:SAM domain-containing protein n=1 Tax=Ceutorhynchus assimilis TaxID=467358 RepID=A0A9N9MIF8_9CUCU|nr:unnamed protein product [Ceutorhynchus assimilis]